MRAIGMARLAALLLCAPMFAQESPPRHAFDVATIKLIDPDARISMVGVSETPDGIDAQNVTLQMLIQHAYGYMQYQMAEQIVGVPDWAKSRKYNVKAKMGEADALAFHGMSKEGRDARIQEMLQALLAERFSLALHRETRTLPDYELVLARGGPKVKATSDDDPSTAKNQDGKAFSGVVRFHDGAMFFQQNSMDQVANILTNQPEVSRLVVNKTGLRGNFTFTLHWMSKGGADIGDGPSIFTKLEEDLGLKLQPSKSEVAILVIDHAEPPTAN